MRPTTLDFDLGEETFARNSEPLEQRALNHSMKKQFPMHKVKEALIAGGHMK